MFEYFRQPSISRRFRLAVVVTLILSVIWSGTTALAFTDQATATPPPNDNLANAISVGALPYTSPTVTNTVATTESGEPLACGSTPMTATVWYAYTPINTITTTITTGGSVLAQGFHPVDTVLAIYTASTSSPTVNDLTQIACNDDAPGMGLLSAVTMQLDANVTYYIQVGSVGTSTFVPGKLKINVNVRSGLRPAIVASPLSGVYQQPVTVTGTNFLPNEPVNIFFTPDTNFGPVGVATADGTGAFTTTALVPAQTYGLHSIIAVGQATTLRATAPGQFTILPLIILNHSSAVVSTTTTIQMLGRGFGGQETVQAHWNAPDGPLLGNQTVTSTKGDFDGPTNITFTVPMSPTGRYHVYAVGLTTGAVASVPFGIHN